MGKEIFNAPELPKAAGYSQAVRAGNLVFVAGTTAVNPLTKKIDATTIETQTDQAIRNCGTILRSAGASLDDVVQVTVLLRSPADFAGMNATYAKHFPKDEPARAVVKLGVDRPDVLVSIMMTAVVETGSGTGR